MEITFGQYIKILRQQRGLSQRALSDMSGVSHTEIGRIERGIRQQPSIEYLRKLSPHLGITLEELIIKAYHQTITDDIKEAVCVGSLDSALQIVAREQKTSLQRVKELTIYAFEHFDEMPLATQKAILELLVNSIESSEGEVTIKYAFSKPETCIIKEECNAYEVKSENLHMVPVLGKVAAGVPIYADENIEEYWPVDISITNVYGKNLKDYFYLRIKGNSMEPLMNDGDLALVHKSPAEDGDIAVVLCEGMDACVKKIHHLKDQDMLMLISRNPDYQPMIKPISETKILGKVVWRSGKLNW